MVQLIVGWDFQNWRSYNNGMKVCATSESVKSREPSKDKSAPSRSQIREYTSVSFYKGTRKSRQ